MTLKSGATNIVDRVLVSAGRTGRTEGLNLDAVGVERDERGLIRVDRDYRTTCPSVFAAGDVIGRPALASASIEQGRMAVGAMFGLTFPARDWSTLPTGIYTIPEACACGPTEAQLIKDNVPYVVGRSFIRHNARGQIIGDTDGFVKLIFHRETRRLLATHLICERATELDPHRPGRDALWRRHRLLPRNRHDVPITGRGLQDGRVRRAFRVVTRKRSASATGVTGRKPGRVTIGSTGCTSLA